MLSQGKLAAVILAAGHGKRMKSDLPKVLHPVGGDPMLVHVIRQAKAATADPIIVIVGHKRELVIPVVEGEGVRYSVQTEQLGTGHAVLSAKEHLESFQGDVIVLSGDVPLLRGETIAEVLEYHQQEKAIATVITAIAPEPQGYGRVLRNESGRVTAIREHKDCSPEQLMIDEINSGIYVFKNQELLSALAKVKNDNAQGEYYLPDVFKQYFEQGLKVAALKVEFDEIHGVNTPDDLADAERIFLVRSNNT